MRSAVRDRQRAHVLDSPDKKCPGEKPKPSRTDHARQVVQEYVDDLRKIMEKLRKALS